MGVVINAITKLCSPKEKQGSLSAIIKRYAEEYAIDPKLVACIIYQESGADKEAFRCEDSFFDEHFADYLTNPPKKNKKTLAGFVPPFDTPTLRSELRARSTSHGPMQVLGETARVMGYADRWLPSCREPEINIQLGCKYLRHLFNKAANIKGETAKLIQVLHWWNGSAKYPPLILEHLRKEKWRAILL